ncbi:hypothetical protein KAX03_01695 [Candidatus Bathyarchaeota archaeon]|nr:hypothetical protein [Candidatus Bathyarchaeota archaeon]
MLNKETLLPFLKDLPPTEKPVVVVDSNEAVTAKKIVNGLKKAGANVKILSLKRGDYVVSSICAIERKTASDFIQTLTHGRLFQQFKFLKEAYEHPLLLLEGKLQNIFKARNIRPRAVWGAIFFLAKEGISVVSTSNWNETVEFIYTAAKQEQLIDKRRTTVRPLKKVTTLEEAQLYIMCGVPLIGREKAKALLSRFGSPLNAFLNLENWDSVKGIGKKIKKQAKKVLATPFRPNMS